MIFSRHMPTTKPRSPFKQMAKNGQMRQLTKKQGARTLETHTAPTPNGAKAGALAPSSCQAYCCSFRGPDDRASVARRRAAGRSDDA